MNKPRYSYQDTILQEVSHRHYPRRLKQVRLLLMGFTIAIITAYIVFFHRILTQDISIAVSLTNTSDITTNPILNAVIYLYQRLIVLSLFVGATACFMLVAFFTYDIHQRNQIIQRLLRKQQEEPAMNNTTNN